MTSEQLFALAVEIEADEIAGDSATEPLGADEIFPLLENLWERGLLRPRPEPVVEQEEGLPPDIFDTVNS